MDRNTREAIEAFRRCWEAGLYAMMGALKLAGQGQMPSDAELAAFDDMRREARKHLRRIEHLLPAGLDGETWEPWRYGPQGGQAIRCGDDLESVCRAIVDWRLSVNWTKADEQAGQVRAWLDSMLAKALEGFVDAGQLWEGRFESYNAFRRWLEKHPEIENFPAGQRRKVDRAQFLLVWDTENRRAFDSLDAAKAPPVTPDDAQVPVDRFMRGVAKRYQRELAKKQVKG